MARIRHIEIKNFRSIRSLEWRPHPGINCLIGPGDSGKSSILDAIDFCLGARRNLSFNDGDFNRLNVDQPIEIRVTLGELNDELKSLDSYGVYLRGFDLATGQIIDEPEKDADTVLTLQLRVESDLEPVWSLVSVRAQAQGAARNLAWADRVRLSPTRLGSSADYHLGWGRGSILNKVSEGRANASAALAEVARLARASLDEDAVIGLAETLEIVTNTASALGICRGRSIKASLALEAVSFNSGAIALHDDDNVPLRALGVGSSRLLVTGLQRQAAARSSMLLIDELEYGLEPHRIIRLLGSLGAKDDPPPLQVFMTSHSPVVLRELSGSQLFALRPLGDHHEALEAGTNDIVQSALRCYPEAFLAPSVMICEGASEVGLLRGLDQYQVQQGKLSYTALGVGLVDCGGGDADRPFQRAEAFQRLGYRVAIFRDDDKRPTQALEKAFLESGHSVFTWAAGEALEDALFSALSAETVIALIDRAIDLHGEELINQHIKSKSNNAYDLQSFRKEAELGIIPDSSRAILAASAKTKKAGWYKTVTWMEDVARDLIGPDLPLAEESFRAKINAIFNWTCDA